MAVKNYYLKPSPNVVYQLYYVCSVEHMREVTDKLKGEIKMECEKYFGDIRADIVNVSLLCSLFASQILRRSCLT